MEKHIILEVRRKKNIDVVKCILDIIGKPHTLIKFVEDRPGHDFRYSISNNKLKKLGFEYKHKNLDFEIKNKADVSPWVEGRFVFSLKGQCNFEWIFDIEVIGNKYEDCEMFKKLKARKLLAEIAERK